MIRRVPLLLLAVAGFLASFGSAVSGAFTVSPTRIELDATNRTGMVTLRNSAETETLVQVEAYDWIDSTSISDLVPTRDILAVPTVFRLAPSDRQIVRIRSREASSGVERAYRLVLSEVPVSPTDTGTGVQFALRLSLPVFITPAGASAKPVWSLRTGADGKPLLRLANSGTAHIHVSKLRVSDAHGRELIGAPQAPFYVLSGKARALELRSSRLVRPLRIEAVTNLGPLSTELHQ